MKGKLTLKRAMEIEVDPVMEAESSNKGNKQLRVIVKGDKITYQVHLAPYDGEEETKTYSDLAKAVDKYNSCEV